MDKFIRIFRPFDRNVVNNEMTKLKFGDAVKVFINYFYDFNKYLGIIECSLSGINRYGNFFKLEFPFTDELYKAVLKEILEQVNYRNSLNIREDSIYDSGTIVLFDTNPNLKKGEDQLSFVIGGSYTDQNISFSIINNLDSFEKLNTTEKIDNFLKYLKDNIDFIKLEYLEDFEPVIVYEKM